MAPNLTPVLTDAPTLRARVHAKTIAALQSAFPLDLKGRTLELKDAHVRAADFSPERQKKALMEGDSLEEVVKGTLVLKGPDGKVIDEAKDFTLVHVPYFTERHTLVAGGNEYQVANMLRRRPGVYTTRRENGELTTTFNLSKGQNFNLSLNPEKGAILATYGTTNIPLYPMLRALGTTHDEIAKHLGAGVAEANAKLFDHRLPAVVDKLYAKLVHPLSQKPGATHDEKLQAVRDKFAQTAMDPEVTRHTLGAPHASVSPAALLAASKKILDVHNGRAEVDDADSLAFKTFHSVDDFLAERLRLTAREWKNKARYALHGKDEIRKGLRPAPFSDSVRKFITTSPLTAVPTGINPIELIDHAVKVTALGEGGIPSERAIPESARLTHPTHYGTLDPIRTPECLPPDCEVLTATGWVRWDMVPDSAQFACNIGGRLEFHRASRIVRAPYAGPMYGVRGGKLAYLVTPNHRLYCAPVDRVYPLRPGETPAFDFVTAERAHNRPRVFDTAHAPYAGHGPPSYTLDPLPDYPRNVGPIAVAPWLEFLGWYISEGSVAARRAGTPYTTIISQSRAANPAKCARIESLLGELPFKWSYDGSGFRIHHKQLAGYLDRFGFCDDKYLPEYVFEAPVDARTRLLDALLLGDGRIDSKRASGKTYRQRVYCTTSARLAMDVERLAISLGLPARIARYTDRRAERYLEVYEVRLLQNRYRQAVPRKHHYYVEQYSGLVYCATVPGGLLYIRYRDGVAHWTGNSGHAGVDLRATISAHRDEQGNLYTPVLDAKTGKKTYMRSGDLMHKVVAFPHQKLVGTVDAFVNGQVKKVPASEVQYQFPTEAYTLSPSTALIPMLHNIQGNRAIMGAKMQTQGLPLVHREAPLVQVKSHLGNRSFEDVFGHLVVPTAPVHGTVEKVQDGYIYIRPQAAKKAGLATTWPNHGALAAGEAARGAGELAEDPSRDAHEATLRQKLRRLGFRALLGAVPPPLVRDDEELAALEHGEMGDWYRHGLAPWDHARPAKTAEDRPVIERKPLGPFTFHIEIKKGTSHKAEGLAKARGSSEDYGHLPGYVGPDGDSLDFFVGNDPKGHIFSYEKQKRPDAKSPWKTTDVKFVVGLNAADADRFERNTNEWNSETVRFANRRAFKDWDHLRRHIDEHHKYAEERCATCEEQEACDHEAYAYEEDGADKTAMNLKPWIAGAGMLLSSEVAPAPAPAPRPQLPTVAAPLGPQLGKRIAGGFVRRKLAAAKADPKDEGLVRIPYQQNFPFPSKTYLHHDLKVAPGDRVSAGQKLADSNFTRNGTLALGVNLRVAYMPYHGLNSNDAVVISESAARRLTSEHMYREVYPITGAIVLGREKHRAAFGVKYAPARYAALDEQGVVKKGSKVNPKDLLVVGVVKNTIQGADAIFGRISKSLVRPYREVVLAWEHGVPGEVVDVVKTDRQIAILVKTLEPMQVGDKLCYDGETEILTERGWLRFPDLSMHDRVATLDGDRLSYVPPTAVHTYPVGGRMYRLDTQQVDLFVTEHHRMYVQPRGAEGFTLLPAVDVAGRRVRYRKDAQWSGRTPSGVIFPALTVRAGQGGAGTRELAAFELSAETYAMLLGAFLSEGNLVDQPKTGDYGIDITQIKSPNRARLLAELKRRGVAFSEHSNGTKVRIFSKQLLEHFRQFGDAQEKHIPSEVFGWARETLWVLFDWLMWGDGHAKGGRPVSYTTTSPRLADDVQRLCLHLGYAANIKRNHRPVQVIKGRSYACAPRYDVRIVTTKLRPEVNHGHVRTQNGQRETWIEHYEGPVHCVTVPSGVVYVRRNGKAVWSGNSGRYGNKGVVAKIIPDAEMVRDEKGNVVDAVYTSAGVVSRINPAQIIETAVAKVAEKTGKPIVYDNASDHNAVKWAVGLLKEHGLKDREHLYDPTYGRTIAGPEGKGILVGPQFTFKLFKSTETNFSGHAVGPYDVNQQPVKVGGEDSAKGIGKMEVDALLAHNARNVLAEAANVRGQRNDEFWRALQLGLPLPAPKPSFAFNKFTAMLEGAGVKVDKRGSKFKLLPLTDADIARRSSGEIRNGKTLVAKNLAPEKGGLFDPATTGGPQGALYSHIALPEPVVNPIFAEPVRRLLGMTEKAFEQAHAERGGEWVRGELSRIDVGARIKTLRDRMRVATGAELNDVVKQIKYLEALKAEGLKPHDAYVLTKVPVIPPAFRPIVAMPNDPSQLMVADANKLYANLMDVSHAVKTNVVPSATPTYRGALYKAVGAVFGTHDVEDDELKGQNVKGFLTQISGKGSPKGGFFQRKLMFRPQDVSGRGTIVPDGNLGMDEIGLPEDMLWKMLDKIVVARLVRSGYDPIHARGQVDQRTATARDALMAEVRERPFIFNRAPTLHRYSMVAAYAKPVQGKTIRMNPFAEVGLNADYDGDTLQIHAPIEAPAVDDAKKMLLSNLLLSDQQPNQLMVAPRMEAIMGITAAAAATPNAAKKPRVFDSEHAVLTAYRKGELRLDDPIHVRAAKTADADDDPFVRAEPAWTTDAALAAYPPGELTGEDE